MDCYFQQTRKYWITDNKGKRVPRIEDKVITFVDKIKSLPNKDIQVDCIDIEKLGTSQGDSYVAAHRIGRISYLAGASLGRNDKSSAGHRARLIWVGSVSDPTFC